MKYQLPLRARKFIFCSNAPENKKNIVFKLKLSMRIVQYKQQEFEDDLEIFFIYIYILKLMFIIRTKSITALA